MKISLDLPSIKISKLRSTSPSPTSSSSTSVSTRTAQVLSSLSSSAAQHTSTSVLTFALSPHLPSRLPLSHTSAIPIPTIVKAPVPAPNHNTTLPAPPAIAELTRIRPITIPSRMASNSRPSHPRLATESVSFVHLRPNLSSPGSRPPSSSPSAPPLVLSFCPSSPSPWVPPPLTSEATTAPAA